MKLKALTRNQLHALSCMARRQLHRWPETKFSLTNSQTHADHPSLGGTNKLFINHNTAFSLADLGLAVINESQSKVWISPGAMQLIRIGNDILRE